MSLFEDFAWLKEDESLKSQSKCVRKGSLGGHRTTVSHAHMFIHQSTPKKPTGLYLSTIFARFAPSRSHVGVLQLTRQTRLPVDCESQSSSNTNTECGSVDVGEIKFKKKAFW